RFREVKPWLWTLARLVSIPPCFGTRSGDLARPFRISGTTVDTGIVCHLTATGDLGKAVQVYELWQVQTAHYRRIIAARISTASRSTTASTACSTAGDNCTPAAKFSLSIPYTTRCGGSWSKERASSTASATLNAWVE